MLIVVSARVFLRDCLPAELLRTVCSVSSGCSCVNFDPDDDFDLAPYLSDFAATTHLPENGSSSCYRLYAVSNHMGSLGGGHYTAYAKVEDQWCGPSQ